MRQWRVGTVSMGLALIFLGIILLVSHFNNWDVLTISVSWLPLILVVLGIEVLVYLFLSQKEQPVVKYDILSIFFISVLGIASILLFVLSSTGIVDSLTRVVSAESVEGALPTIEENVDSTIERIVIQPTSVQVSLDTNDSNQLSIFGTFASNVYKESDIEEGELASIVRSGDTLYVQLLQAPSRDSLGYDYTRYNAMVSVPSGVDVEVQAYVNYASVDLGEVQGDWYIESVNKILLQEQLDANIEIKGSISQLKEASSEEWLQQLDTEKQEDGHTSFEKSYGEGEHQLVIGTINQLIVRQ